VAGARAGAGGRGDGRARSFPVDLAPEPNILVEVEIHKRLVGKVIGPGGETAKDIRRHAQCHLHVRKEPRQDDLQVVEVSGNAQQVRAGVARVIELVTQEAGEEKALIPKVPNNNAITYFDVMPEMIGYVLGNRGGTVKTLREKTGTQIQITDASPETGLQAITIRGTPESVQEAYGIIRSMLEKYDPRRARGPPPGLSLPGSGAGAPNPRAGPRAGPQSGFGHDGPPPRFNGAPPRFEEFGPGGPGAEPYGEPFHRGPPGPMYRGAPAEFAGPGPMQRMRDDGGYGHREHEGPPAQYDGPPAYDAYGRPGPGSGAANGPGVAAAAATASATGVPQVLVLHPDGQYRPAPPGVGGVPPTGSAVAPHVGQAGLGALASNPALAQLLQLAAANNPALASLASALQQATQMQQGGAAGAPPAAGAYGQPGYPQPYGAPPAQGYNAVYGMPQAYGQPPYSAPQGAPGGGYPQYAYPPAAEYSNPAAAPPASAPDSAAAYYSHYSKLYAEQHPQPTAGKDKAR